MRLIVFFFDSMSPSLTCPVERVRSFPPLDHARSIADAGATGHADLERILEEISNALQVPLAVEPSSHMSRKKAIIAVTKSA